MDQEGKTIIQIQEMDFDLLDLDGVYLHELGIRSAIRADNDDEFVQRVSGKHPELGDMRETGYEYSPQLLMLWVIHDRGLKCAKALLDGRTGRTVDLNSPVSMGPGCIHQGLTPVHMVADYSLPDFLELFLNAGEEPMFHALMTRSSLSGFLLMCFLLVSGCGCFILLLFSSKS